MALSDLELVRIKIADKSTITRELSEGDAVADHFQLEKAPVLTSPAPRVWVNNVLKTEVTDYTLDYTNGIIVFVVAPGVNIDVTFEYYWSVFTDEEIQAFIDADGNTTIASAKLLLAIAADKAKLAKRSTLSGGGGLGSVTEDTSVTARELRATAQALLQTESDIAQSIPAEGFTEIPWTEATFKRQIDQDLLRDS